MGMRSRIQRLRQGQPGVGLGGDEIVSRRLVDESECLLGATRVRQVMDLETEVALDEDSDGHPELHIDRSPWLIQLRSYLR